MSIRLAHLSDVHALADGGEPRNGRASYETLDRTLAAFSVDGPPDLLILTGDISEDESPASYRWVSDLVMAAAPITRWLAGNHDNPRAMEQPGLIPTGGASSGSWDYIPVDTYLDGKHYGGVGEDQLTVLGSLLAARADRFVVLGVHHPPINEVCPHVDCQVEDAPELLALLAAHPCVRAVLSGHLHAHFDVERGGIRFLGCPSTWTQIDHGVDPHYRPNADPPAGREVILHDDGSIETRLVTAEPNLWSLGDSNS